MPFRARFDCLWCGSAWTTRGADDLEGWALLCPDCLGKAGTNPFLRGRLRAAIVERSGTAPNSGAAARSGSGATVTAVRATAPAKTATRVAASAFPDDWFLRRGPFERGAIHDTAWAAELDVVTRWLDELPLAGRIDEPGAGVGFFSPLLASKGELHASDPDGAALDRARDRLVAHRLLAHLHVADPWAARPGPEPAADAVVAAFLLGRVRGAGLDPSMASLRGRLRAGGRLALVELLPDAAGGPPPGIPWAWHERAALAGSLSRAGFIGLDERTSGRFFLLVTAEAG